MKEIKEEYKKKNATIRQIERAISEQISIFMLPMKAQDFYFKNKNMFN